MSEQIQTIIATAKSVSNPIVPAAGQNELAPPFQVSSTYSTSKNTLSVQTSVFLPAEITDPANQVAVQQYFDSSNPGQLQFYFVYDVVDSGSGQFQETIFQVSNDPNGGVNLSKVTETFMLMCDTDPKTSRGTTTTVRPTS